MSRRSCLSLFCLLFVLFVSAVLSTASAVPPDSPELLSSTLWSSPAGVQVLDHLAYVAYPHGLAVYDLADASAPRLLGRTYCDQRCNRLELAWPHAFLGGSAGIVVFDVSDPGAPRKVGSYEVNPKTEEMKDFALQGHLAYISIACSPDGRFEIVDFSFPASPRLLGSCAAVGYTVALSGGYAYLPCYHEGVAIVDVSQPGHPFLASRWDMGIFFALRVDGNRAYCIWISGEKAKKASARRPGGPNQDQEDLARRDGTFDDSGIKVYDLSDPLAPAYLGEYRGPNTEVSVDVCFHEGLAYVPGEGSTVILDFSDPAHTAVIGHLITGGSSASLDFEADLACVADGWNGLVTADVSDPSSPDLLGKAWEMGGPAGIAVDERAAYIADQMFGLHVVDIGNPLEPREISRLEMQGAPQRVLAHDGFVYLSSRDNGIDVVDAGDLEHPEVTAHLDLPTSGMTISGDRGYVVKDGNFTSLDLSDPAHPLVLGACTLPLWAWEVCVHGNFAYVGNSDAGLVVVDISDPAHPSVRGSLNTYEWIYEVATDGTYVYANLDNYKLGVFDMSNPDAPVKVREVVLLQGFGQIELRGDRLFLAGSPGVRVFDVSTPDNPIQVGLAGAGGGGCFALRGSFLYMVGSGSLLVLGPSPTGGDAVEATDDAGPVSEGLAMRVTNPVRDQAEVRLRLGAPGMLTVRVYDPAGRLRAILHAGYASAGEHAYSWRVADLAAGAYYVRAECGGKTTVGSVRVVR